MWKRLLCIVLGCVLAEISMAQTTVCLGKTPVEAAQRFYKKYAGFYYQNPKQNTGVLTPTFASVLQQEFDCKEREQGICVLDADPWINAQDGGVYSPRFGIQTTVGELQATVSMNYLFKFDKKEKGKPQSVKLQLTRRDVKSCWMVNEFFDPDGTPLTRTIRNGMKDLK